MWDRMRNSKEGVDSSVLESVGIVASEKKEMVVKSKKLDEDLLYTEVENYIDETEEELRGKQEKALEEFKQGFKGELTAELEEQIANKIKEEFFEELKIERQKFEEEKERLREEELQRVFKESLDLENEISKSNLEIVDNDETEVLEKNQKKAKKQPIQEDIISTNGTTQIYVGQRDGVEIQRRKVSLLRRFGVILKDFLLIVLSLEFVLFIGIILTNLVNPSLELDIVETFIELNITAFKIIIGILQDVWVYLKEKYLQK